MTNKERRRYARLLDRAEVLRTRINAGLCTKLDDERQELSALEWALSILATVTELDIDLTSDFERAVKAANDRMLRIAR